MNHGPLRISRPILEALLAHARAEFPYECCGLLAGSPGDATHHFPLVNILRSPILYEADPRELLAVQRAMRGLGIAEVAIYHSHPTSAPIPSDTDSQRNGYGATIPHAIIGPGGELRMWWLNESGFEEAEWEAVEIPPV